MGLTRVGVTVVGLTVAAFVADEGLTVDIIGASILSAFSFSLFSSTLEVESGRNVGSIRVGTVEGKNVDCLREEDSEGWNVGLTRVYSFSAGTDSSETVLFVTTAVLSRLLRFGAEGFAGGAGILDFVVTGGEEVAAALVTTDCREERREEGCEYAPGGRTYSSIFPFSYSMKKEMGS